MIRTLISSFKYKNCLSLCFYLGYISDTDKKKIVLYLLYSIHTSLNKFNILFTLQINDSKIKSASISLYLQRYYILCNMSQPSQFFLFTILPISSLLKVNSSFVGTHYAHLNILGQNLIASPLLIPKSVYGLIWRCHSTVVLIILSIFSCLLSILWSLLLVDPQITCPAQLM